MDQIDDYLATDLAIYERGYQQAKDGECQSPNDTAGEPKKEVAKEVCRGGNIHLIRWILDRKICAQDDVLHAACMYCRPPIAEMVFEYGSCDLDWALAGACNTGNFPMMEWAILYNAGSFNMALCAASRGGHMAAAEWAKRHVIADQRQIEWQGVLCMSCRGGHLDIAKWATKNIFMKECDYAGGSL